MTILSAILLEYRQSSLLVVILLEYLKFSLLFSLNIDSLRFYSPWIMRIKTPLLLEYWQSSLLFFLNIDNHLDYSPWVFTSPIDNPLDYPLCLLWTNWRSILGFPYFHQYPEARIFKNKNYFNFWDKFFCESLKIPCL